LLPIPAAVAIHEGFITVSIFVADIVQVDIAGGAKLAGNDFL